MKKVIIIFFVFAVFFNIMAEESDSLRSNIFLKSFVFPSYQMHKMKRYTRAKFYLLTDLTLIAGFLFYHYRGAWTKEDYKNYAVEHAGISNPDAKTDAFYRDLKFYDNIYEHNLYAGREVYRDIDKYFWQWDSVQSRLHFKKLRNKSISAYQNAKILIGVIIVNHIIGAIDASRLYKSNIHLESSKRNDNMYLEIVWRFH